MDDDSRPTYYMAAWKREPWSFQSLSGKLRHFQVEALLHKKGGKLWPTFQHESLFCQTNNLTTQTMEKWFNERDLKAETWVQKTPSPHVGRWSQALPHQESLRLVIAGLWVRAPRWVLVITFLWLVGLVIDGHRQTRVCWLLSMPPKPWNTVVVQNGTNLQFSIEFYETVKLWVMSKSPTLDDGVLDNSALIKSLSSGSSYFGWFSSDYAFPVDCEQMPLMILSGLKRMMVSRCRRG